jgi:hypothetical protein
MKTKYVEGKREENERQTISVCDGIKMGKRETKKTIEIEKMFCQRKEDMKRKDVSSLLRIKYRYICLYAIVS